jgi:hypothetical protein
VTVLILISCPDCAGPAEVTDRFVLASTDGPARHLGLRCAAGHQFRMPVDSLPAEAQSALREQEAVPVAGRPAPRPH